MPDEAMNPTRLAMFPSHCRWLAALMTGAAVIQGAVSNSFEQVHRINDLTMQFGTDTFATANQFGGAIVGGIARGQIQDGLDAAVTNGSISILFTFPGLTNVT